MMTVQFTRDTVAQRQHVRKGQIMNLKDPAEARRLVALKAAVVEPAGPPPVSEPIPQNDPPATKRGRKE